MPSETVSASMPPTGTPTAATPTNLQPTRSEWPGTSRPQPVPQASCPTSPDAQLGDRPYLELTDLDECECGCERRAHGVHGCRICGLDPGGGCTKFRLALPMTITGRKATDNRPEEGR